MSIKLRFLEGGAFDSKVIRFTSRCRWSHVEAVAAKLNGTPQTFGAQLKGGVRWRGTDDGAYRHAVGVETFDIRCNDAQARLFWIFLTQQDGKPYDWRAICSFGLGTRDWREDDSWFCSELQARALEVAGLLALPMDIPVWRITPRDLWVLLAGREMKEKAA